MGTEDESLLIKKFLEEFQRIVVRHHEFWTSNDVRAIERVVQELGHLERKLKLINERKKVSI